MITHNENSSYKKDVELLKEILRDCCEDDQSLSYLTPNIQVLERIIHNFEQHQCNEVDLLIGETGREMRSDASSIR